MSNDPVLTYETRYQLDESGHSPNNLVQNEGHELAQDRNRALAPIYGPFFADTVVLVEQATGRTLIYGTHYSFVGLAQMPTQRTGKPLYSVILVTDPNVLPSVAVDYQTIGGEYTYSAETLVEMVNTALVALPNGNYYDLIDVPDDLEPSQHLHAIGDPKGFEYATYALERIKQAILAGQMPAYRAALKLIEDQYGATDARFTALMEQLFESAVTNLTNMPTPPTNPIGGTLIETYCVGTTQMGKYNDGNGSFFNAPIALNSVSCGYVPSTPIGTLLGTYCAGTIRMGTYSDGAGGTYDAVIELNSLICGYTAEQVTQVLLTVDDVMFDTGESRVITVALDGLQPSTGYKVYLTALHQSGILGSIEANGEFSYSDDYAPPLFVDGSTVVNTDAPTLTIVTNSTGEGLGTVNFVNRGNMPPGTWTLSAELVVGTTAAQGLSVKQAAIVAPANQARIVFTPSTSSKSVTWELIGFPASAGITMTLNWLDTDGNLVSTPLSVTTTVAGYFIGEYTNNASTMYYYVWGTAPLAGSPNLLRSPVYTPDPRLLVSGAGAPATMSGVGMMSHVVKGQTVEASAVAAGLVPNTDYFVALRYTPPGGGADAYVPLPGGEEGQIIFSGKTDANGMLAVSGLVTFLSTWAAGVYSFSVEVWRTSLMQIVTMETVGHFAATLHATAGASSIGLRVSEAASALTPSGIDYYDNTVQVAAPMAYADALKLVLVYANLLPETAYSGYMTTPAGNVPVNFTTPADTAQDGGLWDGVSGLTPVIITYMTDTYGDNDDLGAMPFQVFLTSAGLTSNVLMVDSAPPTAIITVTPADGEGGDTLAFAGTLHGMSPNQDYKAHFVLVNPFAEELVFAVSALQNYTADSSGTVVLAEDFVIDLSPSGNVLVGVYNPRIVWQPASLPVSAANQQTVTDNEDLNQEVAIRSDVTFVDISGFVGQGPSGT